MSSKARFSVLARGLKQRDTKAGCPLAGVRIARSIANQRKALQQNECSIAL
jgi:hypothetical protein